MNKKGDIIKLTTFFVILISVMIFGIILAFGSMSLNWIADNVVPEITTLGNVGSLNLSQSSQGVINPLNTFIQSFTWLSGGIYFMMIIFCFVIPFMYRANPSRWLLGFFLIGIFVVILTSIFISNIYEEFYSGTDEVGNLLKEHVLLSFLVIHSPIVFTVVAFISGIIMFSGMQQDEFI